LITLTSEEHACILNLTVNSVLAIRSITPNASEQLHKIQNERLAMLANLIEKQLVVDVTDINPQIVEQLKVPDRTVRLYTLTSQGQLMFGGEQSKMVN
jgi:hypothetical protein